MRLAAVLPLVLGVLLVVLTGCAIKETVTPALTHGAFLRGSIHGGQQPVVGAHVYLFEANGNGYGGASVSLLSSSYAE